MKKNCLFRKLVVLTAVMTLAMGTLAGCGKSADQTAETTQTGSEENTFVLKSGAVEDFVTLGDYKSMTVQVAKIEVTDEQVESLLVTNLNSVTDAALGVTDRVVADGDTVNIDYVGKKDGEEFQGGSAVGTNLTIGSGMFIGGFESGLIGVMPGESVTLDLSFPENYGNADLAGQAVTFDVTVNFILKSVEELTDDDASILNPDCTTMQEVRDVFREGLEAQADAARENEIQSAILEELVKNCTFAELPDYLTSKYTERLKEQYTMMASMYGLTLADYAAQAMGTDEAGFDAMLKEWGTESAKQAIAFQAIANENDLNPTDEQVQSELQSMAEEQGFSTVEEFLGDSATADDYRDYLMAQAVISFLQEQTTVTE